MQVARQSPDRPGRVQRTALAVAPLFVLAGGALYTAAALGSEQPTLAGSICAFFLGGMLLLAMASRARRSAAARGAESTSADSLIDIETGLGDQHQLLDLLGREIARHRRYGRSCSVAVVQTEVVGWRPAEPGAVGPSAAGAVARVIREALRESDSAVRLDRSRFGLLLTECELSGARALIERLRNSLSSSPVGRNVDGTGIYARVWGGAAEIADGDADARAYLQRALTDAEGRRPRREGQLARTG